MVSKQERFVPQAATKNAHVDDLYRRIGTAENLEYAVLLAHVLLTDQLMDLLGLRLHTDTLPSREPNFDALMGLALAGSRYERDRASIDALARARNTVAHRLDRSQFTEHVKEFIRLEPSESTRGPGPFAWPTSESEQVRDFARSFLALTLRIDGYHLEYQSEFPGV